MLLPASGRISSESWPTAPTDTFRALGWTGLAGVVAIAATRGGARRLVGVLIAAAGLGATGLAAAILGSREFGSIRPIGGIDGDGTLGWEGAALLGGLALVAAGVLTAVRGPRWPALGARYDRAAPPDDPWAALDRGEDPTDTIPA